MTCTVAMKATLLFILSLVYITSITGFSHNSLKRRALSRSCGNVYQSAQLRAAISPSASNDDAAAAAYLAIKSQALDVVKSKSAGGAISDRFVEIFEGFLEDYSQSNQAAGVHPDVFKTNVVTMIKNVQQAMVAPYAFEPFHKAIREPFDYYKWGNDFFKPLMIFEESKIVNVDLAKKILEYTQRGENVVILSNHQTEIDPQVISILLDREGLSDLADRIVFIAGHKVTSDPMAIPFSMGRNLICIHSKKHIKNPPEDAPKKQAQNLNSMKAMTDLLTEGGKVFWVAPSGGRDRPDETGAFVVAPFDYKALDMFKLIAMQSKKPMHFFPMAMYTNKLIPPPDAVSSALGEARSAKRAAASVAFLPETDGMGGLKDKEYAADVQQAVEQAYKDLVDWHNSHK